MLFAILFGAPLWVWPLMFFLVGYGIRASRDRETSVIPVYVVPTLGFITLNTIVHIAGGAQVWAIYGAAYVAAALAGYALQGRWLVAKQGRRVTLRGEWLTMLVVMTLFWGNFAWGVSRVVAPDFASGLANQLIYGVIVGLASGSLLGRALRVALAPMTRPEGTIATA